MTGVDRQLRGRGVKEAFAICERDLTAIDHPLGDVLDFAAQPSKLRSEAEFR